MKISIFNKRKPQFKQLKKHQYQLTLKILMNLFVIKFESSDMIEIR